MESSRATNLESNQSCFIGELCEFVSIPSVSELPEHAGDVETAADWIASIAEDAGFENVVRLPTGGSPVVYGDWLHTPGRPNPSNPGIPRGLPRKSGTDASKDTGHPTTSATCWPP